MKTTIVNPSLLRNSSITPVNTKAAEHEPEYFRAVASLSDDELASFSFPDDLEQVRVGVSAYGLHLFGKVKIPSSNGGYIHVRVFVGAEDGSDGGPDDRVAKLHSIHTEEVVKEDGDRVYRAIFTEQDPVEWFET